MSRKHRRRTAPKIQRRTAPGASPGSIVADPGQPKPTIHVIAYGPESIIDRQVATAAERTASWASSR